MALVKLAAIEIYCNLGGVYICQIHLKSLNIIKVHIIYIFQNIYVYFNLIYVKKQAFLNPIAITSNHRIFYNFGLIA